jgi:hypothetical protein
MARAAAQPEGGRSGGWLGSAGTRRIRAWAAWGGQPDDRPAESIPPIVSLPRVLRCGEVHHDDDGDTDADDANDGSHYHPPCGRTFGQQHSSAAAQGETSDFYDGRACRGEGKREDDDDDDDDER